VFVPSLRVLLAFPLFAAACADAQTAVSPTTIRLLTGGAGGGYFRLGSSYAAALDRRLPGVRTQVEMTDGSVFNIEAIEAGRGEVAITQSDATYAAFGHGTDTETRPHTRLRAIALLYPNAVHVAVRATSPFRELADLRGKRVGVDDPGRGIALRTVRNMIESLGMSFDEFETQPVLRPEVGERLRSGAIEAAMFVSGPPVGAVVELANSADVRLLSLESPLVHRVRSRFPFFKAVTIPAATYRGQAEPVQTVGVEIVLVCLDTLPEPLVFDLTRVFFESLPDLVRQFPAARLIDAERAPATPIPLHPGAARFYRERELFR
jgi:TRAP transporter TAXI family solute receptor